MKSWLKPSLQWVHWAHGFKWGSFPSSSSVKLRSTNIEVGDGVSQEDEQQTTVLLQDYVNYPTYHNTL